MPKKDLTKIRKAAKAAAKSKSPKETRPQGAVAGGADFASPVPDNDSYMMGFLDASRTGNSVIREYQEKVFLLEQEIEALTADLDFERETIDQIQAAGEAIGLPPFGHDIYETAEDWLESIVLLGAKIARKLCIQRIREGKSIEIGEWTTIYPIHTPITDPARLLGPGGGL